MKRDDYAMNKLLAAQQRRQAILDFLHAHPWSDYSEMVSVVLTAQHDASPNAVRGLVAHMLRRREIAASGAPRARSYLALVEVTERAEDVRVAYLARQKVNNVKNYDKYAERKLARRMAEAAKATPRPPKPVKQPEPEPGIVGGPGSTVYREGHNPDIRKAQRGQGASSNRSHIGSGMYAAKW
jgi:hypothetical protein